METQLLACQTGEIKQLTSLGFVALMHDTQASGRPDDTEEFCLSDVSEPDRGLVKVGARFSYKTGYRFSTCGGKSRAAWLEFEGSSIPYR